MGQTRDIRYATIANGSDNMPPVSRVRKGAVTSAGAAAYLCNWACTHQRAQRYHHIAFYIPGEANVMADDASRLQHLTDALFLTHFKQQYPQPTPWKLLHLPSATATELTSMLLCSSRKPPTPARPTVPGAASSATGVRYANPLASIHPSVISLTLSDQSPTSSSSASDTGATGSPTREPCLHSDSGYGTGCGGKGDHQPGSTRSPHAN